MIASFWVLKIAIEREKKDFDTLEHLQVDTRAQVMQATERVRRVTWRMGIIGSALTMFLLFCMNHSHIFSAGVVSWITITGCLNFRAYHVEDIGMKHLEKFEK